MIDTADWQPEGDRAGREENGKGKLEPASSQLYSDGKLGRAGFKRNVWARVEPFHACQVSVVVLQSIRTDS